MYFYSISFVILLILSTFEVFQNNFSNKQVKKTLLILITFILAIFSGIRYGVGTDFKTYFDIFRIVESASPESAYQNIEEGFKVIIVFLKSLNFSPYSLFFIFSLLLLLFISRGVEKNSRYPFLSIFLFFLTFLINYVFNALRQGIVMAIFIYLLPDFKEKRFWKVLLFSLLAVTIHKTAVFIIVSYILYVFYLEKSTYIVLTLLSLVYFFNNTAFVNLFIRVIPSVFSNVLVSHMEKFSGSVDLTSFLLRIVILGIFLFHYDYLKDNVHFRRLFNVYFFGFLFYVLFSFQDVFATRINMFFRILEIILLPALLEAQLNKAHKSILFCGIIVIATAMFLVQLRNPVNFPFTPFWETV